MPKAAASRSSSTSSASSASIARCCSAAASRAARAEDIVELANGCICCTVAEDFLPTIEKLLDRAAPPEHIVIETSGLALPKPLVQAFDWPEVKARVTVDGVVAVIDAPALAAGRFADDPASPPARRRSRARARQPARGGVRRSARLRRSRRAQQDRSRSPERARRRPRARCARGCGPAVKLLRAQQARSAPTVLLGLAAAAEDDLAARPSHHDRRRRARSRDFESFVVALRRRSPIPTRFARAARAR